MALGSSAVVREVIALIAYMQRLGRDIKQAAPVTADVGARP